VSGAAGTGREAVVSIDGIAAGGAGVGRLPDGLAVFVHRTAPGERVRVAVTERKRRWARARLVDVIEATPERRDAPCPYYARCGGCTLEHLDYSAQLRAKASLVAEALRRIGGLDIAEPPAVTASPDEFRYRNRVSFALRRLRGGRVVAGFHELERPDRIVDMDGGCLLPEPALARAWSGLRAAWGAGAARLPAGASLRLTLRASAAGEVVLLVEGGRGDGDAEALLREVHGLRAVWHAESAGEAPRLLAGVETVAERWGERMLPLGRRAFVQVNRAAARLLEAHVLALAGRGAGRVVDAYCGIGEYARELARDGWQAVGIELDEDAVFAARDGAPDQARFVAGDVAEHLPRELPADLVILNPPRGGVDQAVVDALRARPPRRIVYVSCDPATLARDLSRLGDPFRIGSLHCFDLFPQTAHVETVVELTCAIT